VGWLKGAFALGLTVGGCSSASATGYLVQGNGDPGTGGTSLRQAIEAANAGPGNIVYFDPALNGSTITLAQGQIAITNSTTVLGPGAGKLTIDAGGSSRIFSISASGVAISGLTLTGGNAAVGAAVFAGNASLNLQDCVIAGNTTGTQNSAALDLTNDTASEISGSTISGNIGGGLYTTGTPLSIVNTTISGNTRTGFGGGIYVKSANLTIGSSTISGNSTSGSGGGIYVKNATLAIGHSTISGNSASGDGGGIFINDVDPSGPTAILTLTDSSVSGNYAYNFGAGIDVKLAYYISIDRSLISRNSLTDFSGYSYGGGGLALQKIVGGFAFISASTFYHNFAYHNGGGIGIFDAATGDRTIVSFSTISGNSTDFYSNGILGAGTPYIGNSIVANNLGGGNTQDMAGSFKIYHSLVKNPTGWTLAGGTGVKFCIDPQLGPLTVNGGPTLTMLPAAGSPVIDAAKVDSLGGPYYDQRGIGRPAGAPDMGAVERQTPEVMIFRNGFDAGAG